MAADTPQARTLTIAAKDLQPGDRLASGAVIELLGHSVVWICTDRYSFYRRADDKLTISRPERAE